MRHKAPRATTASFSIFFRWNPRSSSINRWKSNDCGAPKLESFGSLRCTWVGPAFCCLTSGPTSPTVSRLQARQLLQGHSNRLPVDHQSPAPFCTGWTIIFLGQGQFNAFACGLGHRWTFSNTFSQIGGKALFILKYARSFLN